MTTPPIEPDAVLAAGGPGPVDAAGVDDGSADPVDPGLKSGPPVDADGGLTPLRRSIAAVLSAIVPGAGHLIIGRPELAVVFGLPVAVAIGLAAGVIATTGRTELLARLVDPSVIAALLVVQVAFIGWRLISAGTVLADSRPQRLGRARTLAVAVLVALVILPQAGLAYVTGVGLETAREVFGGGPVTTGAWQPAMPVPTPEPSPGPTAGAPAASAAPTSTPAPSPTPAGERLNVLVIGVDAGTGRSTYLTDTMIVASLDPVLGTVSMLSIPRDLVDVPLPDGSVFSGKVNGLLAYARRNPGAFPGSDGTGHDVLMAALGTLLGLRIDYYAKVSLGGFVRLVNAVGGVDVNVPQSFCDPGYDEYGIPSGFSIKAGRHHLNGAQALAFARVRKASGQNDFTRAARQQEVLIGLRDAVVRGGFIGDPIEFLRAIGKTVETNVPPALVAELAPLADRIDRSAVYQAVVKPPLVGRGRVGDPRGYTLVADPVELGAFAAKLFPPPGTVPLATFKAAPAQEGTATTSGVGGCSAPPVTATPKPAPTPTPTASPAGEPTPSADPGTSAPPSGEPSPPPSPSPSPSPEPTTEPTPPPVPTDVPSPSPGG